MSTDVPDFIHRFMSSVLDRYHAEENTMIWAMIYDVQKRGLYVERRPMMTYWKFELSHDVPWMEIHEHMLPDALDFSGQ